MDNRAKLASMCVEYHDEIKKNKQVEYLMKELFEYFKEAVKRNAREYYRTMPAKLRTNFNYFIVVDPLEIWKFFCLFYKDWDKVCDRFMGQHYYATKDVNNLSDYYRDYPGGKYQMIDVLLLLVNVTEILFLKLNYNQYDSILEYFDYINYSRDPIDSFEEILFGKYFIKRQTSCAGILCNQFRPCRQANCKFKKNNKVWKHYCSCRLVEDYFLEIKTKKFGLCKLKKLRKFIQEVPFSYNVNVNFTPNYAFLLVWITMILKNIDDKLSYHRMAIYSNKCMTTKHYLQNKIQWHEIKQRKILLNGSHPRQIDFYKCESCGVGLFHQNFIEILNEIEKEFNYLQSELEDKTFRGEGWVGWTRAGWKSTHINGYCINKTFFYDNIHKGQFWENLFKNLF